MAIIQFQVCFLFSFCSLSVHDTTVKNRHGMVLIHQFGHPCFFSWLCPQIHPCFVRRYTSQCMLDCSSSKVGWHLREAEVKIKTCGILFRGMHQMLCGIKTPFSIRDLFQFFPHLFIYFCQIADRRPIESQCLANRDILFSYFYAIAGYCLHLFSSNKSFLLSGFFLFPFVLRCKQADGYGPVSPPLPGSEIYILLQDPVTILYILYRFHFLKPFFCILYTRQDDTAKNSCKFCPNGTPILKLAVHPF
ncbi:Uncharacterised protein [uncultured Blautia sp.]|nr:Uncharacterised protein [uncultured Blautia sp.]